MTNLTTALDRKLVTTKIHGGGGGNNIHAQEMHKMRNKKCHEN